MNKKIITAAAAVAGLLVAGHLGASWYVGQTFKNATDAQLARLKTEAPFLRIVSQKNDYGLFNSTQEIVFGFEPSCFESSGGNNLSRELKDVTFGIRNTIQHGPVTFVDGIAANLAYERGELLLPPRVQQAIKAIFGDKPFLSWQGTVDFAGQHDLTVSSPAVNLQRPDGNLNWAGLQGKFRISASGTYDVNLSAPSLQATGPEQHGGKLLIEKILFTAQGARGIADLNLGTSNFSIDKVAVSFPLFGDSSLSNLKFQAHAKADGNFVDIEEGIEVASVEAMGKKYGPFSLQIALNHLHAASLAQIGKEFQKLTCVNPQAQDAAFKQMVEASKASGLMLLQNKPELAIKQLRATLPEGEFLAKAAIQVEQFDAKTLDDPMALIPVLLSGLNVSVESSASQSLILQYALQQLIDAGTSKIQQETNNPPTEAQIATLSAEAEKQVQSQIVWAMTQNFVQADGDKFKLAFKFQNGQSTLNGAPFQPPFPLPGMMPPMPHAEPKQTAATK